MLDWDNLRVFLAAVRAGNYTAAAKRLRIDRTTIGRRLERLEHQIGRPLFQLGEDGHYPTAVGKRVLEVAAAIEELITGLSAEMDGVVAGKPTPLRVAIAAELGAELMGDLAAFARLHPAHEITLRSSASPLDDVLARKADLCVCLADDRPDNVRGRRVAALFQAPYASHEYVARRGGERDLQYYDWVRCASFTQLPALRRWDSILEETSAVAAYVDNWPALLAAVEQGVGAAFLWTFAGASSPLLQELQAPSQDLQIGLWLLTRDDVPVERPVRDLIDFLSVKLPERIGHLPPQR